MTTPCIAPGDTSRISLALAQRTRSVRYGVAVLLVTVAFLLRYTQSGELASRLAFAFFLPSAMLAAWFGGMGPGFLAAAAGLLLGDFFFLPPHHAWGPLGDAERVALSVYAITSTIAVMLMESLHARIRSLECALRKQRQEEPTIPPAAPRTTP